METLSSNSISVLSNIRRIIPRDPPMSVFQNFQNVELSTCIGKNFWDFPLTDIQKYIHNTPHDCRFYRFFFLDTSVRLYICLPDVAIATTHATSRKRQTRKNSLLKDRTLQFQSIARWVYKTIGFMVRIRNINCSTDLSIYLYLSPFKKEGMDEIYREGISHRHVNSAFTYACKKENEIYIFREEEWKKVLLHECIHSFGLDFASDRQLIQISNSFVLKDIFHFSINKDLRIYEAFAETWATILWVLFTCRSMANAKKGLLKEKQWSCYQYLKLLQWSEGISKIPTVESLMEGEKAVILKEVTQVYSYYLLKCRFLYHLNAFLSFFQNREPYDFSESVTNELDTNFISFNDIHSEYLKGFIRRCYEMPFHPDKMTRQDKTIKKYPRYSLRMTFTA